MSDAARAGNRSWSVIVPTRARPGSLQRCLGSLAMLDDSAGEIEVIVVDDDPADSAGPVIAEARSGAARLRALRSAGRGPAAARNLGAAAAEGSILAFTDDDCVVDRGWLTGFAAVIDGSGAAAGETINGAPGAFAATSQLVVEALQRAERVDGGPAFVASNNVCFDAERFRQIGGFDESFPDAAAEDRDLCERWIAAGNRFVEAPAARVVHLHELGPAGFWRQHFRYGRGARSFHAARSERGLPRMSLQARFYRALAAQVRARPGDRVRIGSLALVSQLANASGYASTVLTERHR